jgi:integrase/recombinase XerD
VPHHIHFIAPPLQGQLFDLPATAIAPASWEKRSPGLSRLNARPAPAHLVNALVDENELGEEDAASSCHDWLEQPALAFAAWRRSMRTGMDGGREFKSHSTRQYISMFGQFCRWMAEHRLQLRGVEPRHVMAYLDGLRGGAQGDSVVAPSTRRRYLFLLHRTFEHLVRLELLKGNPCAGLDELSPFQAAERPTKTILLPEMEARFIEWCTAEARVASLRWEAVRNQAMRLTFLASGITVAEAQRLQVSQVLLQSNEADSGGAAPSQRIWLDLQAHGRTPARRAPLASFAVDSLLRWLEVREALAAPGETVFCTRRRQVDIDPNMARPSKQPLSASEIYDVVKPAMREAGHASPRTGPQVLRNTFAARQIRQGLPLQRIMDWMGLNTLESLRAIERLVPERIDGIQAG